MTDATLTWRRRWRAWTTVAAASLLIVGGVASDAGAQRGDTSRVGGRGTRPLARRGVPLRQPGARGADEGARPARQALERRVRQAMAVAVRRELKLDDQKMRSLEQTDLKFDQQRRALMRDERASRQALRAALEDQSTDPNRVSQLMDQLIQAQRRRVDLLDAEQKELSGFLSPRQRAQYFALREQVTRRVQELQQGGAPGGRRGGPPPQ